MKSIYQVLFASSFLLLFFTCKKDKISSISIDCDTLITAMEEENEEIAIAEINTLVEDLTPEPISGDDLGHAENLDKLIERLEEACENLEVSKVCYACIETLPLQSEIKIMVEISGNAVEKIIDISSPEDGNLKAVGMH